MNTKSGNEAFSFVGVVITASGCCGRWEIGLVMHFVLFQLLDGKMQLRQQLVDFSPYGFYDILNKRILRCVHLDVVLLQVMQET